MTDLEISKALASALGWPDEDIALFGYFRRPDLDEVKVYEGEYWRTFDYRDWETISPIAERYAAFPSMIADGNYRKHKAQGYANAKGWEVFIDDYRKGTEQNTKWLHVVADTPQKAIALAVIGVKK